MQYTKDKILNELKNIMQKMFDIDPARITLKTKLYEDLDLDSIDAVDLIVQLQSITRRKFKPEEFKTVRTIGDVVEVIYATMSQ